jgi:hypothetical protein
MANRSFIDKSYALLKGETRLYCSVTVAAAGAVTLVKWNYPSLAPASSVARTYTAAPTSGGGPAFPLQAAQGAEGVFSVVRTAAGLWTVTLQDAYQRLVALDGFGSLAGGLSAIVKVAENTTITNMNSGTPARSIIGVALLSATATALDPASGERINLLFTLQNSTAP